MKNEWFTVRKTPRLKKMVADLAKWNGYISYAELFRAAIREMWAAQKEKHVECSSD